MKVSGDFEELVEMGRKNREEKRREEEAGVLNERDRSVTEGENQAIQLTSKSDLRMLKHIYYNKANDRIIKEAKNKKNTTAEALL